MIRTALVTLMLYAGLGGAAIAGGGIWAETLAQLDALRTGEMRKLVIHGSPRAPVEGTFTSADGTPRQITDSAGKIRIVNFWATWCAPCRVEKPKLDALNQALAGEGFEVIAIATGRNAPAAIERFNTELGITSLTTYLDPRSRVAAAFGAMGLPVSVILDHEGREIGRLQGAGDWDSPEARAIFEILLATPAG